MIRAWPVRTAILGSLTLLLAVTAPAAAQSGFLFSRPLSTVSLLGGWAVPGEGGDLLEFTREELTVEEGDFAAPLVLAELAMRATERFDVAIGLEYASQAVDSEMRGWVTVDDRPIPQTSRFTRTRLLGTVRGYLLPRGEQISRFAWIPNRWSPYLGVGGGITWYRFVQDGDFVDYQTLDIFADEFEAQGHGWTAHGVAGAQLSVSTRVLLRGEYRYILGDAGVEGEDFIGFEDVDLSGSSFLLGVAVRL
jgi:hypothetical protein